MYFPGGIRARLAFATLAFALVLVRRTVYAEGHDDKPEASDDKAKASNEEAAGSGDNTEGPRAKATDWRKDHLGADVQVVLPVGHMADATGPQLGPMLRGTGRISPGIELSARIGYLAAFNKSTTMAFGQIDSNITNIPFWVGARFYPDDDALFYLLADLALNILTTHVNDRAGNISNDYGAQLYSGFNAGVGFVVSPSVPIDVAAQFSFFNFLPTGDTDALLGVGLSLGYSLSL